LTSGRGDIGAMDDPEIVDVGSSDTVRLLRDIKYWLQFIAGLGVVGLLFYWFAK
jgi:hypothetical protein